MKQDNNSLGRTFDAARHAQGFRSQAHLDAFFAGYDHARACPVCSSIAGYTDEGQPYHGRCDTARELDAVTEAEGNKPYPRTVHRLADPISGEGAMGFTPLEDGRVEVFSSVHPDLPAEVEILDLEAARSAYRAAIKAGWVAA